MQKGIVFNAARVGFVYFHRIWRWDHLSIVVIALILFHRITPTTQYRHWKECQILRISKDPNWSSFLKSLRQKFLILVHVCIHSELDMNCHDLCKIIWQVMFWLSCWNFLNCTLLRSEVTRQVSEQLILCHSFRVLVRCVFSKISSCISCQEFSHLKPASISTHYHEEVQQFHLMD